MIELPTERNVLTGHVIKGSRSIPGLKLVSGILSEIWGSRRSCGPIDRRQQNQITSGIINLSAAQSQAIAVIVEPEAVVEHIPEELCFLSAPRFPRQLTPPPVSHPASPVNENAILSRNCSGLS